jgi:hypothetical protein
MACFTGGLHYNFLEKFHNAVILNNSIPLIDKNAYVTFMIRSGLEIKTSLYSTMDLQMKTGGENEEPRSKLLGIKAPGYQRLHFEIFAYGGGTNPPHLLFSAASCGVLNQRGYAPIKNLFTTMWNTAENNTPPQED